MVLLANQKYAAMVMDVRSGKILHSENANKQLHPASLTK
jgi:D-alanyl-D-alanine carboxypeptidase